MEPSPHWGREERVGENTAQSFNLPRPTRQIGETPFNKLKDVRLCFNQFYLRIGKIFNFLGSGAVGIFYSFVYDYLFNQRVEHFSSQFSWFGVLLD